MRFITVSSRAAIRIGVDLAYLVRSTWNDYGYKTTFALYCYDFRGRYYEIGNVKIGERGLNQDRDRPQVPDEFENLSIDFFSLGQDVSYYEQLNKLQDITRESILKALNDIAYNLIFFNDVLDEQVTGRSLLRFVSMNTVRNQFNRMAHGGLRLTAYSFSYTYPPLNQTLANEGQELQFDVVPESQPPTNVHVIIGRNGVGKSRLLNHITRNLVKSGPAAEIGSVRFGSGDEPASTEFANLVSVAFSAFDDFTPYSSSIDKSKGMPFTYIGLKKIARTAPDPEKPIAPKSTVTLAREFSRSVKACVEGVRLARWRRALEMLQGDSIFADAQIADLAAAGYVDENIQQNARELFHDLSSGHKIVLLTITRLVESVEERSLVLLDEPESHLHPPLLSAFVRALSDLLVNRNGAAIIATHSPVVLQEVPKDCVWKLRRDGLHVAADRPQLETFGENVGILTQEVFGLEVTNSGFHRMITQSVESGSSYDAIVAEFGGHLGSEAKALVQALIVARDDRYQF